MTIYSIPEKPAALIFDIDGTLYTNARYIKEQTDCQIRRFAETRNLDLKKARKMVKSYREEWAKLHGGKQRSLGNVLKDMGVPISESIAWRKELIDPAHYLKTDKKLCAVLARLAESHKLICITNNPVSVGRKTLKALGADPFFSGVIGLDTCGISKPDIKIFELAVKQAAASVERCISIGDRYDIDIALPLEMGMGGILVEGVKDLYTLENVLCTK
ncbi:HAD family hydrolase [Treponema sp. OMZ 840]|uniref:HAD family hydrolase n=1 Tax=Treponema sp. OMZ 840 TaxID=244313 RepID=UPI003D8BD50F